MALTRIRGAEGQTSLSGADVYRLGNDKRYPSLAELVGPGDSALTTTSASAGSLPRVSDPFADEIAKKLKLNPDVIASSRSFWEKLDASARPAGVEYFCFASSAHKTSIRNEIRPGNIAPDPVERKDSGDGTVPIFSALLPGVPHAFSRKEHGAVFEDRELRTYLYRMLDVPGAVLPQSADGNVEVGAADAVGISLNKETYLVGEDIEIALSYTGQVSVTTESFSIIEYDKETGEPPAEPNPIQFDMSFNNAVVKELSFTIDVDLKPGIYELRTLRDMDDPEPTIFFVKEKEEG